jgi:hypothetical protein
VKTCSGAFGLPGSNRDNRSREKPAAATVELKAKRGMDEWKYIAIAAA